MTNQSIPRNFGQYIDATRELNSKHIVKQVEMQIILFLETMVNIYPHLTYVCILVVILQCYGGKP